VTKISPSTGLDKRDQATSSREVVRAVADMVTLIEPRLLGLWQEAGMTLSQRRVLGRLRDGPRSAGEIAAGLGISSPSLTRMLTKLEQRGLIVRALDTGDRRRILVELTSLALSLLAARTSDVPSLNAAYTQRTDSHPEDSPTTTSARSIATHG
jgi:DNA-binding MarR family transcriptional regulator